jgi:hypothetical protein
MILPELFRVCFIGNPVCKFCSSEIAKDGLFAESWEEFQDLFFLSCHLWWQQELACYGVGLSLFAWRGDLLM